MFSPFYWEEREKPSPQLQEVARGLLFESACIEEVDIREKLAGAPAIASASAAPRKLPPRSWTPTASI